MALTGKEKAMILLSLLGSDAGEKLLHYLPPEVSDIIAESIDHLPTPTPSAIAEVLSEFREISVPEEFEGRPPIPSIREEAEELTGIDAVLKTPPRILTTLLLKERPQTIAFLLSELPYPQASEILSNLPEARREIEILMKGLKKSPFTSKIKEKIFDVLAKRLEV